MISRTVAGPGICTDEGIIDYVKTNAGSCTLAIEGITGPFRASKNTSREHGQ